LSVIQSAEIDEVRAQRLTPAVSNFDQLRMWAGVSRGWGSGAVPQSIHLKVDTGMHRLGIPPAEWSAAAELLAASPSLRLEGLVSHLAEAEVADSDFTALQERRFGDALALFRAPIQHLANSAAALHRPATRHTLVRAGLALYGSDPAGIESELVGVMSVRARLVQIREIDAGERVGYGDTWVAERRSRIGVVPLGYADGYPWRLSNRARAWIDGTFVPVVGAVNMDLVTLDLTDTEAAVGSTVTLLAGRAAGGPTLIELAERAGTTPYEILCHFRLRLPKRYLGAV
jgi:alanine racemase